MSDNNHKPIDAIPLADFETVSLASLKIHKLAQAFPLYNEENLANLANDLRANGMLVPIVLFEGESLDGRNRVEAAKRIGLMFIPLHKFECTFEQARD